MATTRIGVIMNGVTGRMGTNQHLIRSVAAIRAAGGITGANGDRIEVDPILVGRDEEKLARLARANGVERWTTSLDDALANEQDTVYFDAQRTEFRAESVRKAIAAGKNVYCEKPISVDLREALELTALAEQAGIRHGVVQDKLFLPGLMKLQRLVRSGFFGQILSVRGEFGYWVFEGDWQPGQRPSWNYRKEDGGGIIVDMLCHWRYVLDDIFGDVRSVSCRGAIHIPERFDEAGRPYTVTADDAAYATFELEGGIIAQINSSWAVRVYRDELFTLQVDGTEGSAVAGLRQCRTQHRVSTPKAVWNPDIDDPHGYFDDWQDTPNNTIFDNAFKVQWEMFLRHVAFDEAWPYGFMAGARGVQLAELGLKSWRERRWVDVEPLMVPTASSLVDGRVAQPVAGA